MRPAPRWLNRRLAALAYAAANEERSLEILESKEVDLVMIDYHQPPPFNPVAYLRKLQRMGIATLGE